MHKGMRKMQIIAFCVVFTAVLGAGTAVFWHWLKQPYVLREDIRGKGVDVERIKQQEEKEKDGAMGILRMAGWRVEKEQNILSESTGREERAQVIGVYGSMELAEELPVRCGRQGLDVEEEYCVLSEKLARDLFGSTDIAGEWIKTEKDRFLVVGVTRKEEAVLWIPIDEGEMEMLALEIDGRIRGRRKVSEIFEMGR